MINNDLTHNCPNELLLWIDNDEYLNQQWRHTIRTGNLTNIKDAFEEAGFKYRDDQWEYLKDVFEEELKAEEERLDSYCSILQ
jgi:ribosome assembly protein YihI (activator of Der GTPase)